MLKAAEGVSPADVLLGLMRHYWAKAQDAKLSDDDRARARDKAVSTAKKAAPYFYVAHSGKGGEPLNELSEAERMTTKEGDCDETIPRVGPGEKLH